MRNDDKLEEFDLKVRSVLKDAGEEVPPQLWESLQSRLSPAPAEDNRSNVIWGWTWGGLAFAACALAAFLVFKGTVQKDPVAEDSLAAVEIIEKTDETSLSGTPRDAGAATQLIAEAKPEIKSTASRMATKTADPKDISGTASEKKEQGSRTVTSQEESRNEKKVSDSFAQMSYEDFKAGKKDADKERAILSIGGNIGTNENIMKSVSHYSIGKSTPSAQETISETSISQYGIPVSISAGIRFYVLPRFSIGSGLSFSLLSRTFTGEYSPVGAEKITGDIRHTMCYLGIPVNANFDVFTNDLFKFYVYGQAAFEYCVSNKYSILASKTGIVVKDPVKGIQTSVGAGLGLEFRINRLLGIYLNPGINYYFNCAQPKSIRSDHPTMFTLDAGIRFSI